MESGGYQYLIRDCCRSIIASKIGEKLINNPETDELVSPAINFCRLAVGLSLKRYDKKGDYSLL